MSPKRIELTVSILIVLFLIWVLWEARGWPIHSRLYPWSIGFSVLALAVAQLGLSIRNFLRSELALPGLANRFSHTHPGAAMEKVEAAHVSTGTDDWGIGQQPEAIAEPAIAHGRVIAMYGWTIAFFLGIWLLGFKIGCLLLTLAFLRLAANERWMISATLSVGNYLFLLFVFDYGLAMPLFPGLIVESIKLWFPSSLVVDLIRKTIF